MPPPRSFWPGKLTRIYLLSAGVGATLNLGLRRSRATLTMAVTPTSTTSGPLHGPGLFTPLSVGAWELSHRVVMAPMSRLWADPDDATASSRMAACYAQRATPGGLIVAEASAVAAVGLAQRGGAGLFDANQVNSWRSVVEQVHGQGGIIVAQLWHAGRLVRSRIIGVRPVGASAIAARGPTYAPSMDPSPAEVPEPMGDEGVESTIDQYRQAAENAADAGFDGVELLSASGCLIDQFLHESANRRDDEYGGSIERRVSFLRDAVRALGSVWGSDRVGVRISPFGHLNDVHDSDTRGLFDHVARQLREEGIAYLHVMEPRAGAGVTSPPDDTSVPVTAMIRSAFDGVIFASGAFDARSGSEALQTGVADAIAFGRAFIVHPDLPSRLRRGDAIGKLDRTRLFGPL